MIQAEELNQSTKRMTSETLEQEIESEITRYADGPLASVLEECESKAPEPRAENIEKITLPSLLLTDLVHQTRNALAKIRQINHDSINTMDLESRKSLEITMNQEIKEIDSVLNQVQNYISISTPVIRTNTILTILEETLKVKREEICQKNIRISKKYEENLPETCIHDDWVKFIVNSIFQYAILSSSLGGIIGLFTRSLNNHNAKGHEKIIPMKEAEKTHVGIMVVLKEGKVPARKLGDPKVAGKGDETGNIILLLVKDLVQRYEGLIKFEIFEKEVLTVIDLKLPVCPNLAVTNESINL